MAYRVGSGARGSLRPLQAATFPRALTPAAWTCSLQHPVSGGGDARGARQPCKGGRGGHLRLPTHPPHSSTEPENLLTRARAEHMRARICARMCVCLLGANP